MRMFLKWSGLAVVAALSAVTASSLGPAPATAQSSEPYRQYEPGDASGRPDANAQRRFGARGRGHGGTAYGDRDARRGHDREWGDRNGSRDGQRGGRDGWRFDDGNRGDRGPQRGSHEDRNWGGSGRDGSRDDGWNPGGERDRGDRNHQGRRSGGWGSHSHRGRPHADRDSGNPGCRGH